MLSIDELRKMSEDIIKNPEIINSLTDDQVIDLRKYISPLGNIVDTNKSYAVLSILNWRESYLRNLIVTSFVGYLFKIASEYEPHIELEIERSNYNKATELHPDYAAELTKEYESRCTLIKKIARGTIDRFLKSHLYFDPNKHIRAATSSVSDDPDRNVIWPTPDAIVDAAKKTHEILTKDVNKEHQYLVDKLTNVSSLLSSTINEVSSVKTMIMDLYPDGQYPDQLYIIVKKLNTLKQIQSDLKKVADPIMNDNCKHILHEDIPVDVYHHFNRYITNNFEKLTEVTNKLYNTKPDIEFSVILHDTFKSDDDAKKYLMKHKSEFRTDTQIIETGGVTLLGPYTENRNRIDIYDKNTEILKRIMDQAEADHKLGKDLMEKRLKTQKRKNIEDAGPDDPSLVEYTKSMQIASDLAGANRVLTPEEKAKMQSAIDAAKKIKEDYEVPDDGIQVDMYYPEHNDSDVFELKKTTFYTQEEEPLHMQKNSPYINAYQPIKH